jgi:hypothetical protein
MLECAICGTDITGKQPLSRPAKYCSKKCYWQGRRHANPSKHAARRRAQRAIKVVKCERCGVLADAVRLERHHPDITKPLEVEVLCPACHAEADRVLGKRGDGSRVDPDLRSEVARQGWFKRRGGRDAATEKVCRGCGSAFPTPDKKSKQRDYCSFACANAARVAARWPSRGEMDREMDRLDAPAGDESARSEIHGPKSGQVPPVKRAKRRETGVSAGNTTLEALSDRKIN